MKLWECKKSHISPEASDLIYNIREIIPRFWKFQLSDTGLGSGICEYKYKNHYFWYRQFANEFDGFHIGTFPSGEKVRLKQFLIFLRKKKS